MASPLTLLQNSTLIFQVPTQEPEIDDLGNAIATTEPVTLLAYLTPLAVRPTEERGETKTGIQMKGYCIEPQFLPVGIVPGQHAIATIAGIEGDFYISLAISPVSLARQILGDKLLGSFVQRSQFGEAA